MRTVCRVYEWQWFTGCCVEVYVGSGEGLRRRCPRTAEVDGSGVLVWNARLAASLSVLFDRRARMGCDRKTTTY